MLISHHTFITYFCSHYHGMKSKSCYTPLLQEFFQYFIPDHYSTLLFVFSTILIALVSEFSSHQFFSKLLKINDRSAAGIERAGQIKRYVKDIGNNNYSGNKINLSAFRQSGCISTTTQQISFQNTPIFSSSSLKKAHHFCSVA